MIADNPFTIDGLNEYCQNAEKRHKLLRKHRPEVEYLVAAQLNMMFYTQQFGHIGKYQNYHSLVELPAKLIKIAGITGFMKIARNHPLIMTNCEIRKGGVINNLGINGDGPPQENQ